MGFTYKEIRRAVRWKEQDNDEVRFSDYDIKDATNEAIRYISNELADSNADFNEKQVFHDEHHCGINFKIEGVPLPDDFVALVAIKGKPNVDELLTPCPVANIPQPWEYKIMGGRIYCGSPHFCLVYKAALSEVEDDEDEVDLPYHIKDKFITLVRRILTGADADIMSVAQEEVIGALTPKRRYRNAKIAMPFTIGGPYQRRW